jgi:hypothetical protein
MNSHIGSRWFIEDIDPSIALARAECFEKYRTHRAPEPPAVNVMTDARTARAVYQRELMRRFAGFLLASLFPRTQNVAAEPQRRRVSDS